MAYLMRRDGASVHATSEPVEVTFQTKRWIDYWLGGFLFGLPFVPIRVLGMINAITPPRGGGLRCGENLGAGSLFLAMPHDGNPPPLPGGQVLSGWYTGGRHHRA